MDKDGTEQASFTYKAVEAALALAFAANDQGLLSLRGRLKSFQRNGYAPEAPGRGKIIKYSRLNVYDWGLALAFAEFGLPPRIIINVAKPGTYLKFLAEMRVAKAEWGSLFMIYFPSLFYDEITQPEPLVYQTNWQKDFDDRRLKVSDIPGGRFALINLSDLKHRIDRGLDS